MILSRIGGPVRRAPICAVAVLLAACGETVEAPLPIGEEIVVGEPIRSRPIVLDDSIFVGAVNDLLVVGDELIFPESRGHEVVVLDTLFRFRRRIGREGRGPGELRYPTDVELTPGGLLSVAEVGNARLSVFTLDGRFVNTHSPLGRLTQVPLTDSTFVTTPHRPGARLSMVGSHSIRPFGPEESAHDVAVSDFQHLVPATLPDGRRVVAHIRGHDLSFLLLDPDGRVVRSVAAPTHRTLADLQAANARANREASRLFNARALGSSEITVGQTSPDGRWIPLRYHQLDTTYLYDVWNDRFHPIRFAGEPSVVPAMGSTIAGSTLYLFLSQRGLFAYELTLPE